MTKQEWTTSNSPEALLERLRATSSQRNLRLCAVAFCRRIEQHLSPRCRAAIEVAVSVAEGQTDDLHRRQEYAAINALCFYTDGDSSCSDRFSGFAAEAAFCTLFGADDVPSICNYAATCAIAASRAVVEVVAAESELRGSSAADLQIIVAEEQSAHCELIRSMFDFPDLSPI